MGAGKGFLVKNFSPTLPLGRVGLVVTMSVSCILSPSHAIFLRGRTGAERASSVDWCDLHLELSPKNKDVFQS